MYLREYETKIGAALQPQLSLLFSQACQKQLKSTKVAVVGGGLAGLMAARRLGQHGINVTVFEARPQVGGRVLSNTTFSNGRITEEGAELIGSFHTTWLALAREYGLAVISRMDESLYQRAGLDVKLRLDKDSTLSMVEINKLGDAMEEVQEKIARGREPDPASVRALAGVTMAAADSTTKCRSQSPSARYQVKRDGPLWKAIEFLLVNDEVAPLDGMNFLGLLCKVRGGQGVRFGTNDPNPMGYWDELEIFRCADGCQTLAKKMAEEIQTRYRATAPAQQGGHTHQSFQARCGAGVQEGPVKRDGKLADGPPDLDYL